LISATKNLNTASFNTVGTATPRPTQFQVTQFQEYGILKSKKRKGNNIFETRSEFFLAALKVQ